MTKTKRVTKWMLPAALLLLLALVFTSVPAHAAGAEEGASTDTTEANVSFEAGALKIDSAPVLNFGNHAISHEEQAYQAEGAANLQVSDLRGKGTGWDLYVALSGFKLAESDGPTLKAASIHFASPKVTAVNGTVGAPPAAKAEVSLSSDNTETLLWQAKTGEGMGVWSLGWEASNITLKVKPGTAEEGNSVATLTWSLQSTP
ncbi:WxL domain-containing protein [Ruminococcaceae bacterium OttesenSCG-928-A11]|nr:WxL domain-containing protein [Ruminococcaceae bacterium OttesenSCG-928-A11]